jgi:peptide deformylase
MSKKELIISLPNPHLRQKSKRVAVIGDEVRRVIEEMKQATLDWEASRPHEVGVALAAIQIDQPYRIVIVRNNFEDKKDKSFNVLLNPEVIKLEGDIEEDYEGCLSVADIYGKVPRYTKIRLKAINEQGQPIRVRAEGFLARILQHEIDHTAGKMFVDYIKDKPDAFFKLTPDGKLVSLPNEALKETGILQK